MKTQFGFVLVLMLFLVPSCKKNDSTTASLSGSWKISSLVIDGIDKSGSVSQYSISFNDNGMMSVHDSINTFNCNWSDSGMMESGMEDYHFDMMGCPDGSPMKELDADWVMDSQTDNSMMFHEKNSSSSVLDLEKI